MEKSALGELMTAFNTAHSFEADGGVINSIYDKLNQWAMDKQEFFNAMDPSYVFVNWGALGAQPMNNWNLNQILQADIPVAVENFPDCYAMATHDLSVMLVGALTAQFPGVYAFQWDLAMPILSHIR